MKNTPWRYRVKRPEPLLFLSITGSHFCYDLLPQIGGISWNPGIIRFSAGEFYLKERDWNNLHRIFTVGGRLLFADFRKRLIKQVTRLDKYACEMSRLNAKNLSDKQLEKILTKVFNLSLSACSFLAPVPTAGEVLSQMIKDRLPRADDKTKEDWLGVLTYPEQENIGAAEAKDFYRLAELAGKTDKRELSALIKSHLKKYAQIGSRWWRWDLAWTEKEVRKRLDNFLSSGKDPSAELKNIETAIKHGRQEAEKLARALKIDKKSELGRLIALAREYVYLRTWRTDVVYGAGYRMRDFFIELTKRAALPEKDLFYLTFFEALKLAKTKKMPITAKELAARKKCFITLNTDHIFQVFAGEKNYKKFSRIVKDKKSKARIIRGQTAYPGRALGPIKVVETGADIGKVKRGDILAAVMTFPNFVPAMEQAAAFVTDEGGILCHAAIIAREMKKPCVIGTKIATAIFHDGDYVEVDATNGVVRKIKE